MGLLSTELRTVKKPHLPYLHGILSQTQGVIWKQLRVKKQLGQGHPVFQAKGNVAPMWPWTLFPFPSSHLRLIDEGPSPTQLADSNVENSCHISLPFFVLLSPKKEELIRLRTACQLLDLQFQEMGHGIRGTAHAWHALLLSLISLPSTGVLEPHIFTRLPFAFSLSTPPWGCPCPSSAWVEGVSKIGTLASSQSWCLLLRAWELQEQGLLFWSLNSSLGVFSFSLRTSPGWRVPIGNPRLQPSSPKASGLLDLIMLNPAQRLSSRSLISCPPRRFLMGFELPRAARAYLQWSRMCLSYAHHMLNQ